MSRRARAQPLRNRDVFVQLAIEYFSARQHEPHPGGYLILDLTILRLPVLYLDPAKDRLLLQADSAARLPTDAGAALGPARDGHAILESLGGLDEGEILVRQVYAAALDGNQRTDEARGIVAVAMARLAGLADRLPADLRTGYLAIREHAALRALADRLGTGD